MNIWDQLRAAGLSWWWLSTPPGRNYELKSWQSPAEAQRCLETIGYIVLSASRADGITHIVFKPKGVSP